MVPELHKHATTSTRWLSFLRFPRQFSSQFVEPLYERFFPGDFSLFLCRIGMFAAEQDLIAFTKQPSKPRLNEEIGVGFHGYGRDFPHARIMRQSRRGGQTESPSS